MIELNIRDEWFSLPGHIEVTDKFDRPVLFVHAKSFSIPHEKEVQTLNGTTLYTVMNKIPWFFNRKAVIFDANGDLVAMVKKQSWVAESKFIIQSSNHEYTIIGHILDFGFQICRDGIPIGKLERKISLRYSFVLTIYENMYAPLAVAFIVALDNILHARNYAVGMEPVYDGLNRKYPTNYINRVDPFNPQPDDDKKQNNPPWFPPNGGGFPWG